MADDPKIHWTLANSFGIWMEGNHQPWSADLAGTAADQWNAGRATDLLIRADGNLVVASSHGGIWLIGDTSAVCASDRWEDTAFLAVAQGPDDDQHIFAGGEGAALYMTDLSRLLPLLDWIRLDSIRKLEGVGTIRDILVLRQSRVIVLACDGGIFWSRIGSPPAKFGPPAVDDFVWRQAKVEGDLTGGFISLSEGAPLPGEQPHPSPDGPILQTLMAGARGGDADPKGLFWGMWDKPDRLVLRRSRIFNQGADVTLIVGGLSLSAVGSCASAPHIGYAVCVAGYSDVILFFAKTTDGGRNWNVVDTKVPGLDINKNLGDALGSTQGGHNICVGVSNTDPDMVTIGFRNGALSFDGGHTWQKPGFDPTQVSQTTDHLHADLTSFAFARPTTAEPIPPDAYYVSSDGGVAKVTWGDGAWVIESDRLEDGRHGNLYAVVLDESKLVLHVRHSGSGKLTWEVEGVITSQATGRGCLIQSTFQTGDSFNGNLEVVVPEGNELVHYSCPIQNGHYTNWGGRGVITHFATGPGCLIQSTFGSGSNGNLEVVALEGSDLVHYWQDSANTAAGWHQALTVTKNATGAGCLIQSQFGSNIFLGLHGNLEVVVQEGPFLVHYWHDSSSAISPWHGPTFIHQADSAGCFFVSDYNGNFELVYRLGNQLMHSFRDNGSGGFPWSPPIVITAPGRKASGPACVFQGNYGSGNHGNFELLVPEGASVVHYYRDNDKPGFKWFPTFSVMNSAFKFRSNYNRNLATLEFFPNYGGSNTADLALAGPLQDNGTVDGIAGPNGTPWFQLEGGDGQVALYLSGRSPRIPGKLEAGTIAIHLNNEEQEDDHLTVGIKSAHLQSSTQKLILDDHGKGSAVIHLDLPKPGVTPVPPPEKGLRKGSGAGFQYEVVRSPENFPKGTILAALAVQGLDLYVLLVAQDLAAPRHVKALDMHWEYQFTFTGGTGVNALACADGLTAIVELAVAAKPFSKIAGPNFWRLDLSTGKFVTMPVADSGSGSAQSIAIVSTNEAYAAVTFELSGIGTKSGSQIMCWNGTQWVTRASPALGPGEGGLISVTVDPMQTPATIFAATASKVYISRDSAKSWVRASNGLPVGIHAHSGYGRTLQWVRDGQGSHVYFASFGRSIWSITTKETW